MTWQRLHTWDFFSEHPEREVALVSNGVSYPSSLLDMRAIRFTDLTERTAFIDQQRGKVRGVQLMVRSDDPITVRWFLDYSDVESGVRESIAVTDDVPLHVRIPGKFHSVEVQVEGFHAIDGAQLLYREGPLRRETAA